MSKPKITLTVHLFSVRNFIFAVHAQLCSLILKITLSTCRRSLHYDSYSLVQASVLVDLL